MKFTLPDLDADLGWEQPGNVGNDNATGPLTTTTMTPSRGALFTIKGDGPYANAYWLKRCGAISATEFRYALDVMFPAASDIAACQALEFEMQQSVGGKMFNMAWQLDFHSKTCRPFNYAASAWEPSSIPVPFFTPGAVVSLVSTFSRKDGAGVHKNLFVNGYSYPVDISHPLVPKTDGDYFNVAFQMDTNANGDAYSVWASIDVSGQ